MACFDVRIAVASHATYKQGEKLDLNEWREQGKLEVNTAISSCYGDYEIDGWSENHITTQVLSSLMKLGQQLVWANGRGQAAWKAYKLKGNQEKKCGDIALLVKVHLTDKTSIEGVAYYEAKRQYFKKGCVDGFTAVGLKQLKRLESGSLLSQVVFYDINESLGPIAAVAYTAIVAELEKGNELPKTAWEILPYGENFISKLARNFRGFELDFRVNAVAEFRQWADENKIPFIVKAEVKTNSPRDKISEYINEFLDNYEELAEVQPQPPRDKSQRKPRF